MNALAKQTICAAIAFVCLVVVTVFALAHRLRAIRHLTVLSSAGWLSAAAVAARLDATFASTFPVLHGLEARGLVVATQGEGEYRRYRITPKGRAWLRDVVGS